MNTFVANLKTYFQCPGIWIWHIVGVMFSVAAIVIPVRHPVAGGGYFGGFVMITMWIGLIASSMNKGTMTKPLSFCLPSHSAISTRVLFSIGAAVSVVFALTFLAYPGTSVGETLLAIGAAFALGLAFYTVGVLALLALSNTGVLWASVFVVGIVAFNDLLTEFRVAVERTVLDHPLGSIAASALLVFAAWRVFRRRHLARKLCGTNFLGAYSLWNSATVAGFERKNRIEKLRRKPHVFTGVLERFFISRMRRRTPLSGSRYIWGIFYTISGHSFPVTLTNILFPAFVLVLTTIVLGYVDLSIDKPGISKANLVLFAPVMVMGASLRLDLFSTLLLPAGRRERLGGIFAAGVASAAAALILGFAICGFSVAVDYVAHEVTLRGETYTYFPVLPKAFFLFFPSLPILLAAHFIFPRYYIVPAIVVSAFSLIIFRASIVEFSTMSPVGVAILNLVSWLPFIAITRHYCYFWDLASRGR
jgi:hypothetical protein